tara:strand:- start:6 stop:278 length:273 start_codon:yes stop_codon:yes gene_type:complete
MEMVWDVFDDPSNRTACTIDGEQLSDGIHEILYEKYRGLYTKASVQVTDGKFVESTEYLIGQAVQEAGYFGQFIEGFERTENGLEVIIGS